MSWLREAIPCMAHGAWQPCKVASGHHLPLLLGQSLHKIAGNYIQISRPGDCNNVDGNASRLVGK